MIFDKYENQRTTYLHIEHTQELISTEIDTCVTYNHNFWKNYENELVKGRTHYGKRLMDWVGVNNLKEFEDRLKFGWPEAREKTKDVKLDIHIPMRKGMRRKKKRSDSGDELDIQAVYSGDLDTAWQTFDREETETLGSHNVTLITNISTSANVHASNAFWKGAAATLLCSELVKSGYNVEIVAMANQEMLLLDNSKFIKCIQTVKVKNFQEVMDEEFIFTILSPGFYRIYMFKLMVLTGNLLNSRVCDSLGIPSALTTTEAKLFYPGRKFVVIPHEIESKNSCETFLRNTIEQWSM